MTRSVRAEVLMHLTWGQGWGEVVASDEEEQHGRCGVWRQRLALKSGSRNEGGSLEGAALRLTHPGTDPERQGRKGLVLR